MKRTTLLLYIDQLEAVLPELTMEERGELLTALTGHAQGEEPDLSSTGLRVAYSIMAKALDANYEHYDQVREKRTEAGRRSREAAANKSQQMLTNANTCTPSTGTSTSSGTGSGTGTSSSIGPLTGTERERGADAPTTTTQRGDFKRPSLDEVRAYCESGGYNIVPEAFLDYYEANGWMVGRSKMKDWKAAVRTWARREAPATKELDLEEIFKGLD